MDGRANGSRVWTVWNHAEDRRRSDDGATRADNGDNEKRILNLWSKGTIAIPIVEISL